MYDKQLDKILMKLIRRIYRDPSTTIRHSSRRGRHWKREATLGAAVHRHILDRMYAINDNFKKKKGRRGRMSSCSREQVIRCTERIGRIWQSV